MYLCAGAALAGLFGFLICVKKGRREDFGIYFLILTVSGVFGLLTCFTGDEPGIAADGKIVRPMPGEGDTAKDYLLDVEDLFIDEPYRVVVENRHLTKGELEELFAQAVEELEQTFLGANESLDHITKNVVMAEQLLEGRINVGWSFDRYEAVNLSGELQEEALTEEGTLVEVTAVLSYESAQTIHQFSMMVYPPEKTLQEQFFSALAQALANQNSGTQEDLTLPSQVAGHRIIWKEKPRTKQYTVLLLGLFAMAGAAVGKKRDMRKDKEKRDARLLAAYPQMISQMALLLGAGMTVSYAWERMVLSYEHRRTERAAVLQDCPIYEEMSITYYQIKDGLSERSAYEQFGERLNLQEYRRFATLLVQNLRKGTAGLGKMLEKQVQEAFEDQKSFAKKRGEELETKLLLPMMLMLGLVIVIIMIPAIASFQL